MRNAQVPSIVLTAGYSACPLPRRTPAGISYRLQTGSNSKMHMMRTDALATTAASGVKRPEKKSRVAQQINAQVSFCRAENTRKRPDQAKKRRCGDLPQKHPRKADETGQQNRRLRRLLHAARLTPPDLIGGKNIGADGKAGGNRDNERNDLRICSN